MRSTEDLQERLIQPIPQIMERTGIYASTDREKQFIASQLLGTSVSWTVGCRLGAGRVRLQPYAKSGVAGPFEALCGSPCRQAEVASVYAEVFHRLGYLTIDNPVTQQRRQEMTSSLRERFEGRDVRRSEAERILSQPSPAR